jgi:hypothetical protein
MQSSPVNIHGRSGLTSTSTEIIRKSRTVVKRQGNKERFQGECAMPVPEFTSAQAAGGQGSSVPV